MERRGMPTGPKGGALVILVVLGAGLAGSSILDALPLGLNDVHPTCTDGIDQPDAVFGLDAGMDFILGNPSEYCLTYPFSDGNGEIVTNQSDQGKNPGGYSVRVWDIAYDQYVLTNGGDVCQLADFYANQVGGNGHWLDTDGTLAQAQFQLTQPPCVPPPPP